VNKISCNQVKALSNKNENNSGSILNSLALITEYGVYLYLFFLFFDKGEGLRNIGLYGAFTSWLILFFRKEITIPKGIILTFFSVYILTIFLSSVFSLEPLYSIASLRKDVLKAVLIFLIISTYFNNKMVLRTINVMCLSGLVILSLGLHSFLTGDLYLYTSDNLFLSADKNKYGFIIALIVPFYFFKLFRTNSGWKTGFWTAASLWGLSGTILSASKGAVGSVITSIIIFSLSLFRKKYFKFILPASLIFVVIIASSFNYWPEQVKTVYIAMPNQVIDFNERTYLFWKPAVTAVEHRPLLGWGYGKQIYRDNRPFENGSKPDWEKKGGLHSAFISILFHQGIIGLASYVLLLLAALISLVRVARNETNELKLTALALLSIICGSFFVNSFVKTVDFRIVAVILAMSAATCNNDPESDNTERFLNK